MSKFFMYGSELKELEQLMMLVPNFLPRRSGVIVVQRIKNEAEPSQFKASDYSITDFCRFDLPTKFLDLIAEGKVLYDELVSKCFEKNKLYHLEKRLDYLSSCIIFINS